MVPKGLKMKMFKLLDWVDPKKLEWDFLSKNPSAIELLLENPKKIDWMWLSSNSSPQAIDLLKAKPEKINWSWISANPSAIDLLKANPEKINWKRLSANENIFINLESTAITIQRAFRKSKMYAEWSGHPDRLLKQGYFNDI